MPQSNLSTRLIIIRHGNTFLPGETPRRVGGRTDLPLVPSGEEQARALGRFFKEKGWVPTCIYTGPLQRTLDTAVLLADTAGFKAAIVIEPGLKEIDYGPDENQPEEKVLARIGPEALAAWENENALPKDWVLDISAMEDFWKSFAKKIEVDFPSRTIFAVTSAGVARFAPVVTGDIQGFRPQYALKLATGAFGVLEKAEGDTGWKVTSWNNRPA